MKTAGLESSTVKVLGSPALVVHETVSKPPLAQFVGVVKVSALASGARTARIL